MTGIKKLPIGLAFAAALLGGIAAAGAETFLIDLTHPIPTFKPMEGDPLKADLNQPWLDSKPHPTFDQQAILTISEWPTNQGYFDSGKLIVDEHHGTHFDTPAHYLNNAETMDEGGIAVADRHTAERIVVEQLVGPVVLIDISSRVQAELDKNGGNPNPDKAVTDFSDASGNVVTADDIAGIADKLQNGAWLVMNLGWSKFYFDGGPEWDKSVYLNGFNHPGMSHESVDKLVQVLDEKNIQLAGLGADNLAIDTGQGNLGDGPNMDTNVWYTHVKFLQRNILLLENMANLGELTTAMNDGATCTLVVGAMKHTRGTGSPSRVMAMCER